MNDKKKKIVQTCLPMDLHETLCAYAKYEHRTLSGQIRQILKLYFQQLKDTDFRT